MCLRVCALERILFTASFFDSPLTKWGKTPPTLPSSSSPVSIGLDGQVRSGGTGFRVPLPPYPRGEAAFGLATICLVQLRQ